MEGLPIGISEDHPQLWMVLAFGLLPCRSARYAGVLTEALWATGYTSLPLLDGNDFNLDETILRKRLHSYG